MVQNTEYGQADLVLTTASGNLIYLYLRKCKTKLVNTTYEMSPSGRTGEGQISASRGEEFYKTEKKIASSIERKIVSD